ncbi:MAG: DUF192 domain-containing protein [Bacteroidetes bacterium QH_7_62_13]|nr:MAG: DUF192 domain-containing protein [Bacteroidetes bacterium QH_7_62_13]
MTSFSFVPLFSPVPNTRLLFLLIPLILAWAGCTTEENRTTSVKEPTFQEGTLAFYRAGGDTLQTINLAVAESDAERKRGLMRQRSLGYDQGMLFIFDEVSEGGMWMKSTPLPLDIVFVAPDSQVINIARRTTPFSEETIEPAAPRKFVVEVRAGFADRFGLTDSTRIRWTRAK